MSQNKRRERTLANRQAMIQYITNFDASRAGCGMYTFRVENRCIKMLTGDRGDL